MYYITNTIINRQYLLSSSPLVSLSLLKSEKKLCSRPPNSTTHIVVDDTFYAEREWPYLLVTESGIVSYKMEYSILYDIIIMML